jgi:hypothetical protein
MEMTRGASREDLFMELCEPLELNEEIPCELVSVHVIARGDCTHIHAITLQRVDARSLRTGWRAHRQRRRAMCLGVIHVLVRGRCCWCC